MLCVGLEVEVVSAEEEGGDAGEEIRSLQKAF